MEAKKGYPPMGLGPGISDTSIGNEPGPPLQLQWSEGIQTEFLGVQNTAENPDSLGWKRSYAPFASADGTQASQVGNQTRPPHSESQSDPPWGHGVRGWEGEYKMVAEVGQILTSVGGILLSFAS